MFTEGTDGTLSSFAAFFVEPCPPPAASAGNVAKPMASTAATSDQRVRRKATLLRNRFGLFLFVLRADAENDHQKNERHDETHLGYSTTISRDALCTRGFNGP
jgi:hypothetical protein